jgi:hypothetical protein
MLSSQKYTNTTRTITGLTNDVYPNDVILLCNTLPGPVAIDLQEIPANFWNTNYKLYLVDINNNASVNNITINAPVGYTINNLPSLVISVNGGRGIVTISSNNSYNCELNYSTGGGGILTVQDQGVNVSSPCTLINFVGNYVLATGAGANATVTINPNILSFTYGGFSALITGSSLIPGQFYSISNAIFTASVLETVPVIIQAVSNNTISLFGSGVFLNADYQNVGNYSGVPGFVANLGVWSTALIPVVGDVVIWNNLHFVSLTGVNAAPPNLDLINWSPLVKSITTGYILEVDEVTYNISTNQILSRKDKRNNYVENNVKTYALLGNKEAFLVFQWGSEDCISNLIAQESWSDFWNSSNEIKYNSITGNSFMSFTRANTGNFLYNSAQNNSKVNVTNDAGLFLKNVCISTVGLLDNYSNFQQNHFESVLNLTILNLPTAGLGDFLNNYIFGNYVDTGLFIVTNEGEVIRNTFFNCDCNINNQTNASSFKDNNLKNSNLDLSVNNNIVSNNNFDRTTFTVSNVNAGIISNNVSDSSIIFIVDQVIGAEFSSNNVSSCNLIYNLLQSLISFNTWERVNMNLSGAVNLLANTTAVGAIYNNLNHNIDVEGGIFQRGVGTIRYELDMNDPAVFNPLSNALSIPAGFLNFFGEYNLTNNAGYTIDFIVNLSQYIPVKFTSGNGTITISVTTVGLALPQNIISPAGAGALLLVNRVDGNDSIVIKGLGQFNGIEQINLYI